MDENWTVLRIMYSQEAFGKTGSLTHDLINMSKQLGIGAFEFEGSGGYTVTGSHGRNYLWGGTPDAIPKMMELIFPATETDRVTSAIKDLLAPGKDNILYYTIPATHVIMNEDRRNMVDEKRNQH